MAAGSSFARMEDGTRIWFHDSGGEGTPIVLHHGHTSDRASWGFPVDGLSEREGVAVRLRRFGHRVVVMECRGAGESDDGPEGSRNIPQFARDVVALLDCLGLATCVFAGHSMGGGVGFELACHHSSRLSAVVLMTPVPAKGFAPNADARRKIGAIPLHKLRDYFFHKGLRSSEERWSYHRGLAWHPAETEEWARYRLVSERRCGHTLEGMQSMFLLDLQEKIASVRVPVLMLGAAADPLLPLNVADFERMPTATLHVVAHAGHELGVHAPEDVARAIDAFLRHGAHNYRQVAEREEQLAPQGHKDVMRRTRQALVALLKGASRL